MATYDKYEVPYHNGKVNKAGLIREVAKYVQPAADGGFDKHAILQEVRQAMRTVPTKDQDEVTMQNIHQALTRLRPRPVAPEPQPAAAVPVVVSPNARSVILDRLKGLSVTAEQVLAATDFVAAFPGDATEALLAVSLALHARERATEKK